MADPDRPARATAGTASGRWRAGAWRSACRAELRAGLEIIALCGVVVTQPLLDITGRSPDFFLFHRAGRGEILLLVGFYTVVPPLGLWLAGALSGLAGRAARALTHRITVGLLLAALAVQVGKHLLPLRGTPLLAIAVACGAAGAYAHRRWPAPGRLLRFASPGPLVFALLFVFASPTSAMVLPRGHEGLGPGAARGAGRHPPVVLLLLDELPLVSLLGPDGAVDARRFPNFAALAGESTWYRNATGVSGWTPYAVPAMLTGRYPTEAVAPHYSRYPDNLFTALGGVYDIEAQESITRLCPPSRCDPPPPVPGSGGLPVLLHETGALLEQIVSPARAVREPEASYREVTPEQAARDAAEPTPDDPKFRWDTLDDNQPVRFTEFLAGLHPAPRPTLHFLHLLMPHTPWTFLPSGARYDAPEDLPNDGDGWVTLARERHLAQLGYTDRLIGETLRTLRATGLYDDALVVVTADHGVSFTRGAQGRGMDALRRAPGEVAWVPMFVKEPGQRRGRVDDRNWEHVDLTPTIADWADVTLPWRPDGLSARGPARQRADKRFYDEPGRPVGVPGPATFAAVTGGTAHPLAPPPELVGRRTADLPVGPAAGVTARVVDRRAFDAVDPTGGRLPALVYGTVPKTVPTGTRLAVAVNGRIGAVVPVLDPDPRGRRFAALLADDSLFAAGANRLELFTVAPGDALRRVALAGS
ncbi:sulfatase-like hydrolase/transferase [Micromonospora sp. NPDC049559]|uniref:sulfatase-like hydrolase/transferase n=1 Tax=Micromonospora sp. NPDC049559 TaxID=3155923 RepID=UPI0034160743